MSSQENHSERSDGTIERPPKRESPIFNHFQAAIRKMFQKEAEGSNERIESDEPEQATENDEEIPDTEQISKAEIEVRLKKIRDELDMPETTDQILKQEKAILREYKDRFDWKKKDKEHHTFTSEEDREFLIDYCKMIVLKKMIGMRDLKRTINKEEIIPKLKESEVDASIPMNKEDLEKGLEEAWDQVISDLPEIAEE